MTPLNRPTYRCLGLKTIFDLRSVPEIKRDGPEWANIEVAKEDVFAPYGIHRAWVPVFAEQDYVRNLGGTRRARLLQHGEIGIYALGISTRVLIPRARYANTVLDRPTSALPLPYCINEFFLTFGRPRPKIMLP